MNVELFTLCDAATVSGGKLNVLGSFDSIWARAFPCNHSMCAIACKVRFDASEEGKHVFDLSFSDPDMRPVIDPIHSEFDIKVGDRLSLVHVWIHHFVGFRFEQPGEYYFELRVDGQQGSRVPLWVAQMNPRKA